MNLPQRLLLFLRSLNPNTYSQLCEETSVSSAFKQFFFLFGLFFLIMLILFIPAVFVGAPKLQQEINKFDSFSLDADVSGDQRAIILKDPLVAIDLGENVTMKHETLLFTKNGIEWRSWYLFGHDSRSWAEVRDAKGYSDDTFIALLIFIVPSVAFWLGIIILIKDLVVIIVAALIAALLPRLWNFSISFSNAFKVALFASAIMLLVEMLLLPFARIPWLPLLLFLVFFIIGVTIVGDRDMEDHPARRGERRDKGPWE